MKLPLGTDNRIGLVGGNYFVFIAPPPLKAGCHLLDPTSRPGELTAMLIHDSGCTWPDRTGEHIAETTLAEGGAVILQFARLADAMVADSMLSEMVEAME